MDTNCPVWPGQLNYITRTSLHGESMQRVAEPLGIKQRIVSLDVLRGVALLGILPMNIQAFSMIGAAYVNPSAYGDLSGANYWVWFLSHLFTDQKFLTIFSMLFGAGVLLMTSHVEASGTPPAPVHHRRMGWLMLFGLLHGYLLWYGDVLLTYGLCGLLVFRFRHLPPRRLITIGLMFIAVAAVIFALSGLSMPYWPAHRVESFTHDMWRPTPQKIADELRAYRSGWLGEMPRRFSDNTVVQVQGFLFISFWRVEGSMLIGMALFKLGVLTAQRSRKLYWWLIAAAVFAGLPVIIYGAQRDFAAGWEMRQSLFFYYQYNYWGSILVALGWVGVVMLACQSALLKPLTKPFAAVGRMAFTNYVLDTLICTSIFYGFGFGLYGKVSRTQQIEIVFAISTFQLIVSSIWLRYFRFGPFEWLWRSLTYRKRQAFRLPVAVLADTSRDGLAKIVAGLGDLIARCIVETCPLTRGPRRNSDSTTTSAVNDRARISNCNTTRFSRYLRYDVGCDTKFRMDGRLRERTS